MKKMSVDEAELLSQFQGVISIWAIFYLAPIEIFAKVEAMSESRSIEDLPIIIALFTYRIDVQPTIALTSQ